MSLKPDVTVAALIERDGSFLVVEELIDARLVFNQPAGHLEPGETLIEAVVRETREETARRFLPQALLGVYLWREPRSGQSFLRFAFTGSASEPDERQPLDQDIVRTHWLTRGELLERQPQLRSPLVMRCVDDYLSGQRHALSALACLNPLGAP